METQGPSVGIIKRFFMLKHMTHVVISLSSLVKKCINNAMERYVAWGVFTFTGPNSGAEFRLYVSQREAKGCVRRVDGETACKIVMC
jgi:hypothetical protein